MYEQARHECAVRYLCYLRHKKGLKWFRNYIAEKENLHKYFEDYAESIKPIMQSRIQPYRNKYLVALHKRGLLPDIMGISKKKMLKILSKCESHREVLLHSLKKFD